MLASVLLAEAIAKLRQAGVASPEVDAELLMAFTQGISRAELQMVILNKIAIDPDNQAAFLDLIEKRASRIPLQHLTGRAAFRHIELEVGRGVFTPRPETEGLVGWAIELGLKPGAVIVDLCSGSGAIAISLATEIPDSQVYAVEKSPEAFSYLTKNFQNFGLPIANAVNSDLNEALGQLDGEVDLVISNPPYIPDQATPVDLEVQLHEPKLALYGGPDGLDVIREISKRSKQLLNPGGALLLEHADTQAAAISELLLADGWQEIDSRKDLTGKDRMILARKAPL